MVRRIMVAVLVLTFISGQVFAQQAAAPQASAQQASEPQEVKTDVTSTKEGYVSLDFQDANIRNVLEILALKSGVNIVASPEVKGTITLRLNDVPWQDALDVILQTYGYAFEKKGNVIVVSTVTELKKRREDTQTLSEQEAVVTKTFTLNFAKAAKVVESIGKMKSTHGNIDFDERTNTVIITDAVSKVDLMGSVIRKLDSTTPQVSIEAKIVETTFTDAENFGIDWAAQITAGGAKRPIVFPFGKRGDADLSLTAPNAFPGTDTTTTAANTQFSYGTLDFTKLQAVFQMLKTKSDTNILSNPRIVTLDNQTATIKVGEQYPIPQYTYNEQQATLQISGWEYKDVGIIFDVTPHVNDAGFVTLDVEPKITAITTFVTVENTSVPRLSNESAKTSVVIKEGETLVIGGLLKNQTTDTKKKVPLLGDIPIVGLAFQKKEKSVTKTDLLIFITPHIVTPQIPTGS
ncbi:MAG: type IV pilus secretin PilQ [Candidatus Omnitrophica bacterium]|nr:type IV pilus secretin PilQ [Candidatus Omnitrophota bacterium]